MDALAEAGTLLAELRRKFDAINSSLREQERLYKLEIDKINSANQMLEQTISERADLENVLTECKVGICKYKLEFERIKKRYSRDLEKLVSTENFHFFTCYRGDYYSKNKSVIDLHREIIDRHGFCWWGKFNKERRAGRDIPLEPFGESISLSSGSQLAVEIRKRIEERTRAGKPVYLFMYNPNPPNINLFVANVIDVYFDLEKIPYQNSEESSSQCRFVPRYYFKTREKCDKCTRYDAEKCPLRFTSNFWFKIDRIAKLDNIDREFGNLINCFTKDTINFAVPILYPLLVTQGLPESYFQELVLPEINPGEFEIVIPEKEHAHTRVELVNQYFRKLHRACINSFFKVVSFDCTKPVSNRPVLGKTPSCTEIVLVLPPDYRLDGSSMRFKIYLGPGTNEAQKERVESLLREHLTEVL